MGTAGKVARALSRLATDLHAILVTYIWNYALTPSVHLHGKVLTLHFSPLSAIAIHKKCINVMHVFVCDSNLLAFTVSTLIQEAQQTRWRMH